MHYLYTSYVCTSTPPGSLRTCSTLECTSCVRFPQVACWWDGGRGANAYSAMSDIDWSKRDNWISPAYQFSSMADTDWGWKKRSPVAARMQQRQSGCTTTSPSSSENPKHSSHVIGIGLVNSLHGKVHALVMLGLVLEVSSACPDLRSHSTYCNMLLYT